MEPLLHPVEVARRLIHLGRTRFYQEVAQGRILTVRVGQRTLVPHASLERFVADRIAEAEAKHAPPRPAHNTKAAA